MTERLPGASPSEPRGTERPGIPAGRIAAPDEIAAAVSYLASPGAGYTTGASLVVDGGLMLMAAIPLQEAVEGPAPATGQRAVERPDQRSVRTPPGAG
jgi:hypothetical protein